MGGLYFDSIYTSLQTLRKALEDVEVLDELDVEVKDRYILLILNDLLCSKEAKSIGPSWITILLKAAVDEELIKDKISHARTIVRKIKDLIYDSEFIDYTDELDYRLNSGLVMWEEDFHERTYYRSIGVDC